MAHFIARHFHFFCGSGSGARGFNRGHARIGTSDLKFECIGGIDVDPMAIQDFDRMTGAQGTVMDLFDRDQYRSFHGKEPGKDWREATPEDIRRAAGYLFPHIIFLSAPCKGFSGLLNPKAAASEKYKALNRLTLRGIRLMLEAFADNLPELIIFENVPRIATRGRELLDDIRHELEMAGYSTAETFHDCGKIGGLAQSRKRMLLVARHRVKVPPFLYEPPSLPLRGVGEVLGALPMPDAVQAGPMHRCPRLTWETWVRLALIPPGKDWRALEGMEWGKYAVVPWEQPAPTVIAANGTGQGAFAVADPRVDGTRHNNVARVAAWDQPSPTVTGGGGPSSGGISVADPRPPGGGWHDDVLGVCSWEQPMGAVTSQASPTTGAFSVQDPRSGDHGSYQTYRVIRWNEPAPAVTSQSAPGGGGYTVADPRVASKSGRDDFQTAGHYGVLRWDGPAGAVTASGQHDNGAFSVADPRPLPAMKDRPDPVPRIVAIDGSWHRPMTTLDLAALQFGADVAQELMGQPMAGVSHTSWREHIGNAVPIQAAEAIAGVMAETLLRAWTGQRFALSGSPIWVRPLAVALSVESPT